MQDIRQQLITKLQLEYFDLIDKAEKLHKFINQARLSGSSADKLVRETLPNNHYSYMDDMNEQFKAMQKYAYYLSYRISYLQEEIDREEKETNHVTVAID